MKELERIKSIENEVSRKTENARRNAEKKIAELKSGSDKQVQDELEKTRLKLSRDMEKARVSAEREAADMLSASDARSADIEKAAEKNFTRAVQMILEVFRNGRA